MTDRTGREHTMKRIAIVLGIAAAIGVSPSVASGGNVAQVVRAQVVESQIARSQVVAQRVTSQQARAQRAKAQRVSSQRAQAARVASLALALAR
jgi:hypothetical protein